MIAGHASTVFLGHLVTILGALTPEDLTTPVVDACTLNNAMNALQIALLIALLRWVHRTW